MMDAALIKQCADPTLKIEIVEKFIAAAGTDDNLKITVRAGDRLILVPKPTDADAAMGLIQKYFGRADVRVGVTQYPAGLGVSDATAVSSDLLDPCQNIRMGTALFVKVYRIVTKWYGAPSQYAFADAVDAYKTGTLDGIKIFYEPDPGATKLATPATPPKDKESVAEGTIADQEKALTEATAQPPSGDPNTAGIRIDLSGVKEFNTERKYP